jgi:hypothetical protein
LIFERAQKDLESIATGGLPALAKRTIVEFDGGTTTYECEGYRITRWQELIELNGVLFQKLGLSISFSLTPNPYGNSDVVACTWLKPLALKTPDSIRHTNHP